MIARFGGIIKVVFLGKHGIVWAITALFGQSRYCLGNHEGCLGNYEGCPYKAPSVLPLFTKYSPIFLPTFAPSSQSLRKCMPDIIRDKEASLAILL